MTTVVATYLTGIEAERVRWIWPGHLAKGKLTIHEGDPGLGKSTVGIDLIARLSTGAPMPMESTHRDPMRVGIICDEDGLRDTIIPRLLLVGANMGNICQLTGRNAAGRKHSLLIPNNTDQISDLIRAEELGAFYIDPLDAHAGPGVKLNNPQDVRAQVMGPLGNLTEDTDCLGILARHPNKQLGLPALYRGGGALGIIGAARFGSSFGRDPQDKDHLIMACVKCNIGPMPPSLGFRLDGVPGSDHAVVRWDTEPCDLSADDIVSAAIAETRKTQAESDRWLIGKMIFGPRLTEDLKRDATNEGIGWSTVEKAKHRLHVQSNRQGFGPGSKVWWLFPGQSMPSTTEEPAE